MTYKINKRTITNDYVMLFFDEDKIMVSIDDYFAFNLTNSQAIEEDLFNKLKENEKVIKTYRSCLRKLASKDHSILQIRKHLAKYDLDNDKRNEIIDKLIQYHLLDDEQYAINRINILDNQNLSYRQILNKLKDEGIKEDIIFKYLREDYDKEFSKAKSIAEKYLRSHDSYSLNNKKKNVLNKLITCMFSYELSKSVLDGLTIDNKNEIELLKREYIKIHKRYSKKYSDYELKNKTVSALLNKGFEYQNIKEIMEEEIDEND